MQHIGFIMDGNRSWAKKRFLPAFEGHRQGYQNTKKIIRLAKSRGISYVSLWALSDDNIANRSKEEVEALFRLLSEGMRDIAKEAQEEGNRIVVIGDRTLLPGYCNESIDFAEESTKHGKDITTIVALGYGGQEEIVRAVKKIISQGIHEDEITKELVKSQIESSQFPPPDLIIRTGGHFRHSGFLLFQSPYAEYAFSEKDWPEFDSQELDRILSEYNQAVRKFGK